VQKGAVVEDPSISFPSERILFQTVLIFSFISHMAAKISYGICFHGCGSAGDVIPFCQSFRFHHFRFTATTNQNNESEK
jgi:hypothetical protein